MSIRAPAHSLCAYAPTCSPPHSRVSLTSLISLVHRLSARLYQITNDANYLSAGVAAASFVSAHMYDGHVIVDGIRLSPPGCTTLPNVHSDVSGYAIYAFALLSQLQADPTHGSL